MCESLNAPLQGTDHLTLTWKVEDNILHHIDIREQGKPNQFSLGKSLWIGSDVSITSIMCNVPITVLSPHLVRV